ncbi:phosphate ABC transporter permease [Lysinibacillus contaminans]|uniref:Phosphate transport system permease protein n=1 Tax=Lysinibacillus contaminans TaxID=1293441 RepID=A0ABR5JZ39_9BACI|nr:phosphate ABC transporter permease subunit PstC [Lysinibacillus contaminans]KOS67765.1 phosphate ABC transporter permease [Lysinibacillus contaminans]
MATQHTKEVEQQISKGNARKYFFEKLSSKIFLACALLSVISLLLIVGFVFYKGANPFVTGDYSFLSFIFGSEWVPSEDKFGIFPMIVASIYATMGALVIGVPVGLFTAIFLAEIAPKRVAKIVSPAIQLLAGIPSVLYGVFGLAIIVPFLQDNLGLARGQSLIAVILVLAIMMLPTIVTIAETAIRAVPKSYREGSLALGVSEIGTIFKVVVPAAKSGIMAAIVLGLGRALGETMAVILVAGNSLIIPTSLTDSIRPLTTNIALEMGYAAGTHLEMLFATGIVLFSFILILNFVLARLTAKGGH